MNRLYNCVRVCLFLPVDISARACEVPPPLSWPSWHVSTHTSLYATPNYLCCIQTFNLHTPDATHINHRPYSMSVDGGNVGQYLCKNKTCPGSDLILFSHARCAQTTQTDIYSAWRRLSLASFCLILCFIHPTGCAPPFCPLFAWVELDSLSLSSILSVYLSHCCLLYGSSVKLYVCVRALPSVCVCVYLCPLRGGVSYLVVCYHGRSVPVTERERNGEVGESWERLAGLGCSQWAESWWTRVRLLQTADKTDSRAAASPTASILTLGVSATAPSKFSSSIIQNMHSRSLPLLFCLWLLRPWYTALHKKASWGIISLSQLF